jgi:hypothetical protein
VRWRLGSTYQNNCGVHKLTTVRAHCNAGRVQQAYLPLPAKAVLHGSLQGGICRPNAVPPDAVLQLLERGTCKEGAITRRYMCDDEQESGYLPPPRPAFHAMRC